MPCIHTYGPNNLQRACKPRKDNPFLCEHTGLSGTDHHVKCAIQWIDNCGNPTPDYNDAIGMCWIVSHVEFHAGISSQMRESEHFPICAEHAKQLNKPGMHLWRFVPLAQYCPPEQVNIQRDFPSNSHAQ